MKAKEYEKILNELANAIAEGVHIVDGDGKTILYSGVMADLELTRKEDVLGKSFDEVFSKIPQGESTMGRALYHKRATLNKQQTYLNQYGKEITTVNSTIPIVVGGEVVAAMEIANDITDIKSMSDTILDLRGNQTPMGYMKERTIRRYCFEDIIGETAVIKKQISIAKKAAKSDATVFIYGETGTGKELFAQSIHYEGRRKNAPFLAQNCAALPESLLEGILFGTSKGGFTGAEDRAGLFEQADGGTLLLDEVSAMPYELQSKLLRVLQEDYIRRVGGSEDIPVNVRIIATVNEPPEELIARGELRKDLYYRLNVINLNIPPLKERVEDIPVIAEKLLKKQCKSEGKNIEGFTEKALLKLKDYSYPGNVRELENLILSAVSLADDQKFLDEKNIIINKLDFSENSTYIGYDAEEESLDEFLYRTEKRIIENIMSAKDNNISRAADSLGIKRQTLQHKLKKFEYNL